jgi:hypothetical protein
MLTTISHGVATLQPVQSTYATNADSVRIDFTASDPDDSGVTPTLNFEVIDLSTGKSSAGTGSLVSLSAAGAYRVQYWSTDADDPEPTAAHSILIAIDREAPFVKETASPNILWPPNGKFVTVTVTGTATDTLSGVNPSSLRFHVVDEYGRVQPAGLITDMSESIATSFGGFEVVNSSFQVSLQSRRFGFDFDGRQYHIDVAAMDMAGNVGFSSTEVTVPHDMGRHHGHHGSAGFLHNAGSTGVRHHASQGSGGRFAGVEPLPREKGKNHGHGHGQSNGNAPATTVNNPVITIGLPSDGGNTHSNGHGNGNGNGNENGQANGNGNGQGNGNGNGHGQGNGKHGNG